MKKYTPMLALFASIITVSFVNPSPKSAPFKPKEAGKFNCAAPTNLSAVKSYGNVVLSWSNPGGASSWSYGGYYNTPSGAVFFGASTFVWPIALPNSGAATSITFRVTAVCTGGGSATSAPYSGPL